MIKTLQRKFVIIAMIAVSVLMVLLLGAVNVANILSVRRNTDNVLYLIASHEVNPNGFLTLPEAFPPLSAEFRPRSNRDRVQTSPFFVIRFLQSGEVIYIDSSRIPSLDREEIKAFAQKVWMQGRKTGKVGNYRYLIQPSWEGYGQTAVFLDTSDEMAGCLRVLLFSGGIGFTGWIITLVLVIILSRKAIRPIAENIEKQKQFVTNASHEIKTPLAIIQSNVDALELYQGESKWSHNIQQQTIRLTGLMKNLLLLSRMDESKRQGAPHTVSFASLIPPLLDSFAISFQQKNLNVCCELAPDIVVHADKEQLIQLVSILLENAGKYAQAGSEIRIRLQPESRSTKLCMENVCDPLPTVPPERLFDRFYRADQARTQVNGGYGIGLSIAKALVEANRGTITATYILPNRILFTVTFPPPSVAPSS